MNRLGVVVNPRAIPSATEYAALRPAWVRSIVYTVGDVGRLLETKPTGARLCVVVNNECREVGGDWGGWGAAMQAIARNYGGLLDAVECTNEPDIWWASNPADMPPAFTAQLVREANRILTPAGIRTIIGSVAGPKWQEYLQAVAGYCRDAAHGAAFHPYGQRPDGFEQAGWGWGDMRPAVIRAYELAGLPIWLTEWGVKLSDAGGEQGQADYLRTGAATIAALGEAVAPMAAYFCWRDDVGAPSEQGPSAFGLMTTDGRRRPAWQAFAALTKEAPVPTHQHIVGEGVLAEMARRGDSPASCEQYENGPHNTVAEFSRTFGRSGRQYVYVFDTGRVNVYPPEAA
jgi:hypothetical protein